ncbi:hypothetical protein H4CHR_00015 [Variovorax sp. PBS-H4]|uniref:Spy/CpxP family protein refolding chaperone n=1 Tax=Variovorax sp. PBS-H4 TaxID=434008 RepID=UPI00131863A5|nr:Spy/CpxP family protein refolding chaperone [Variovorax sp. PBS-H4]VTU17576.1 hypothetical protein H4CHR_00015 [Variovorax sp. PBS-H4]
MISSRQKTLMAGLIASAAFACSTGFAQGSPAATAAPAATAQAAPADAKASRPHVDRTQRFERMQAKRAQRLAELKQKLRLDASQEGAWNNFTATQQRPRSAATVRMDRAEFAKLTTPQRLERMQARQAERSARFTQRVEATRSFYATLSPEQQKTFDAETIHAGHRGGHGHQGPSEGAKS